MSRPEINVLFVDPSGAGGVAHTTYRLAKGLINQNTGCHILTAKRWQLAPLEGPYHVHTIFNGMRTPFIQLLKTCIALRPHIDVVHWQSTTHPRMMLNLMRLFPLKDRPWVWTVHNVLPHEETPQSKKLYGKIYNYMDGLIFHTEHSKHEFAEHFPHLNIQHEVIPLGEYGFLGGTEQPEPKPAASNTLLFFGNIRRYKGLDIMLEAMPMILKEHPETRLIIAGQALEPFEPYQKLINQYNLNHAIELHLGYIPDTEIHDLFSQAQITPLPYRAIDQSAVLLLSLALGKTVVGSKVGGIPEVIRHGETGYLVEPNTPKELASVIIKCLKEKEHSKKIGEAARIDARQRYSWDTIAEKTNQFYRRLLNQ